MTSYAIWIVPFEDLSDFLCLIEKKNKNKKRSWSYAGYPQHLMVLTYDILPDEEQEHQHQLRLEGVGGGAGKAVRPATNQFIVQYIYKPVRRKLTF